MGGATNHGSQPSKVYSLLIRDMSSNDELSRSEMAAAAGCSERAIPRIQSDQRLFGSVKLLLQYFRVIHCFLSFCIVLLFIFFLHSNLFSSTL